MIAPNIHRRAIAVFCCILGLLGFKAWQARTDPPPTSFLIRPNHDPDTATQDREISEYAFGGDIHDCIEQYEISNWMDRDARKELRRKEKECPGIKDKARQFILKNWKETRKAYLVIAYYCADCSPVDYIFIEPDRVGHWNIVFRTNIHGNFPGFDSTMYYDRIAVAVKWRPATVDDFGSKPGKPLLTFLDVNGNEVATL